MVVRAGCSSHTCRNGEYDEADYDMCWARWMIVMMMQKPKRLPMLLRLWLCMTMMMLMPCLMMMQMALVRAGGDDDAANAAATTTIARRSLQ